MYTLFMSCASSKIYCQFTPGRLESSVLYYLPHQNIHTHKILTHYICRGLFNTLVIIVYINYLCSVLRSQILLLLYMYYNIIDTPLPLPPISSMAHKFLLRENNKTCCNLELVNLEFYIKMENVRFWQNRVHARHVIL